MKIIYRGTPPSEREYRGLCHSCKTVIEFKASEAKRTTDMRDGDGDYLSIRCPVCSHNITVSVSNYITPSRPGRPIPPANGMPY
jgi:RNase P subunit RPR2